MNQLEQFNMDGLKKADSQLKVGDINTYQGPSQWKKRVLVYGGLFLIAAIAIYWSWHQAGSIATASAAEVSELDKNYHEQFLTGLNKTELSGTELAEAGMSLLQNDRFELASCVLQVASQKDPQFRDAALYAGFAELARADKLWENNPTKATSITKNALHYLEIAAKIDPINAYTFELMALAHANLGETDLAAQNQVKATDFAI
jgi:hypothetical protein